MPSWFVKVTVVAAAAISLCAQEPDTRTPDRPAKPGALNESQGIPPRASPSDYQTQAKAGAVTIAAEFDGHAIPTPGGPLSTDNYVVVETALFGAPAKLQLAFSDFSLRINGKKTPLPSQPYGLVIESVKDPNWNPPEQQKSKTSFGSGGGDDSNSPPAPVKVPIELQRAMAQRVEKASLAEGNRPLPQAGLLYFRYGGKAKGIHSIELIYSGPAGNTTLELQP